MAEGDYEFRPKPTVLGRAELDELTLRVAPSAEAVAKGFTLNEADVDRVIQAARELEGGQVLVDPNAPPQQSVEMLLRVVRILQAALDVQFSENEELTADFNELQNNEIRKLREENNRLREMRERDELAGGGDVGELKRRNEDLLDQLDELEEESARLREAEKEFQGRNQELEDSIKEREKDLLRLQTRLGDVQERYDRQRDDYKELQQRYRSLSQEFDRVRAEAQLQDTKQQSEWKIERLTKDNRALEVANTELRKELQDVKSENLEVSEKIVELNTQYQELLSKNVVLETRVEEVANDKDNLLSIQDELRAELQDKMNLLDEFEDRFKRQYSSWEDEKAGLVAQIEALRRELKNRKGGDGGDGIGFGGGPGGASAAEVAELRRDLNDAREKEILLLEAYEQLENDVSKEVDRALARQAEEVARLQRRVDFLQGKLEQQDDDAEDTRDAMAELEGELRDAVERNKLYEQGVYGLPQAVEEIRQLKSALAKEERRTRELIVQLNKQAAKVEDLHDENAMLRQRAGLGEGDKVDIKDIKMQKEATIAQLRALNALLERQVADLEEERRKLRMEMKFRAKYHGQHALEMGLTNEKLLLLEQYADDLKNNRVEEARVVEQMQQRIEFLEVRLAEVMAYADIPPSMRPALSEFDPTGLGTLQSAMQAAMADGYLGPGEGAALMGGGGGAHGPMPAIKAKEIEAVRKVLASCMKRLRQMSQSLFEHRNVKDEDYGRYAENVAAELSDADQVLVALLKDPASLVGPPVQQQQPPPSAGGPPSPHSPGANFRPLSPGGRLGGMGAAMQLVPGDASYLADAIADELREKLKELAKEVADLQVDVAKKDVRINQLMDQKNELEKKIGMTMGDRKSEYVTMAEYEGLQLEVTGLKDQLIGCLEELASREKEVAELHDTSLRYHGKMQTFSDQVKLLYREYAGALTAWKVEKATLEKKGRKAQADADAYKIATRELQTALDTLSKSRDMSEVEKEYLDTVRRMAVVQIKQAKLARELEASVSGEKALVGRVTELEEEVRDVSSTARGRIRWLEQSGEQTKRRLEQLFRELEASVGLTVYHSLVAKHSRLQHEYRKLLEEAADAVVAPQQEELLRLREEVNEWMVRYDQAANAAAELKAKLHQAELLIQASPQPASDTAPAKDADGKAQAVAVKPPPRQTSAGLGGMGGGLGSQPPGSGPQQQPSIDPVLGQELAAARVQEEAALRRAELVERERDRVQKSLADMHEHGKELEQRLAQNAAELELARQTATALERRLVGAKTKGEVDEMTRRLHEAEKAAADVQRNHAELALKAEEAERRAEAAGRDRLRFLAEITNLKAALRDMSGKSDKAALIGKLHLELDHSRAKESLARNALNRSELIRIELEKEVRRQKQELANLTGRMTAHQDQAAWSDRQRHEAQAQLTICLSGRTEAWKARLWARKIDTLKIRNDALADGLELARRRILKTEDARQEAELKLEHVEQVASYGSRGPNELAREAARLGDQLLQLRLEKGKMSREDMLLKEKIHYTERVNAELHDLLDKYEAEYFQSQSQLEADRSAAEARAVALQSEVVKLQERINALLAARELGDNVRASTADGEGGGVKNLDWRGTMADRDRIIALIEQLKVAREEAEHLRTDRARLQADFDGTMTELEDVRRHHRDALDRLAQQSDALLYALNQFKTKGADDTVFAQMKAVAEATINELKARLKDRDRLVNALRAQLDEEAAQALARHQEDRAEIERLNQKLFERNDASIQDLKSVLDRLPLKQAGQQVPEEQLRLRDALERAQDMITVLKNRLDQKDAAIDVLKLNYEQQIKALQDEMLRVRAEAEARVVARDEGPTKAQLQKLATQVKMKDEMLRQLKSAIKALETKLTQVMKEHADEKMQAASWQAQERLQAEVERLMDERDSLARRLALAEDNVAAAAGADKALEDQLGGLRRRIQDEVDKRAKVEKQLSAARDELQKFKNAKEAVVDLTTGMSIEAKRQIEELQKKINVLEKNNAALKRKAQAEDAVAGGGGGPGGGGGGPGGDDTDGPGGRRPTARSTATRRTGPAAGRRDLDTGGGRDDGEDRAGGHEHDPEAEERRERALIQWEEGKKLNGKIDALKRQLASKTNEVVALQKELERRATQVGQVQAEAERQAAAIRDLTDKLRKAQDAPRNDKAKLDAALERCAAAEEAREALTAEVARLRSAAAASSAAASQPPPSPGGAQLRREEDVTELRLQRDQLQLQVRRLKDRLAELGAAPEGATAGRRAGSAGPRTGGAAGGLTAAREAELLSVITNLKTALEKATSNTTPTTKYMAEVSKRKDAQREVEGLRGEVERAKAGLAASSRMVAELQAANAELRKQVRNAQTAAASASAAAPGPGVAELGVQLSNLEMLLGQREEELAALRGALAARDSELEALRGPGGAGAVGGGAGGAEAAALRRQLRELEAENEDLRNELNAFDPSFWDEVMEMKRQHAELSKQVAEYEDTITELSDRLGVAPRLAPRGGSGAGSGRRGGLGDGGAGPSGPRRGGR
ncbi:hypothetical protein HYH02_009451 [Chlamydomonas schloesseri]|uniref:Centrosomal protein of 290kDa coiled-coil region domain-containing protein n=1 Tax=Chlamydomonas schloesseri TaxID=2026947 RepID=A0A835W9Y0_9CHLO|nr:hypothetical protein HYH02_009451 [Chlamydomonas schloesseri]|eukprot:KAG2443036.1 hypothetical protein HYH02_009451 [Chlamydomonas schloesseri]